MSSPIGDPLLTSQDLYNVLPETNSWEEIKGKGGRVPFKRYGHSAVVRNDEMWVFGGFDSESMACGDLWSFHFRTRETLPLPCIIIIIIIMLL